MIWVWVLLIVVLTGAVVVVAVGRGDSMSEVYDDRPDTTVSLGRPLTADDVQEVRFTTAVRGYRMDEVDAFMARLGADLLARETRDAGPPTESPAGPPSESPGSSSGESRERGAHVEPSASPAGDTAAAPEPSASPADLSHASGPPRHLPESPGRATDQPATSDDLPATSDNPRDPAAPPHEGPAS